MMECKKALVEVDGDLEAAKALLRKLGQASADKKAGRIAAEGRIELAFGDDYAAAVEVNCESDFVAKDHHFRDFARQVAELIVEHRPDDLTVFMAQKLPTGGTLEDARRNLVTKVGENISVRRFEVLRPDGQIGSYVHSEKIGVLVDVEGGDDALRKDLAMHIAASRPSCVSADDVSGDVIEKERAILTAQAEQEG